MQLKIGVIGAGSFGLTMAKVISHNAEVLIYSRNQAVVDKLNQEQELRGVTFENKITATSNLSELVKTCKLIVPVIPAASMRALLTQISTMLTPSHFLIHATKGLDYDPERPITVSNVKTMSQLITELTPVVRIGCISGPNLAKEIIADQPTATVVASEYDEVIKAGMDILSTDRFFVFGSHKIYGVELAGALKNIFALGSGLLAGMHLGKNVQALMLTRGLQEMIKIGEAMGAGIEAFLGTAGIGDLIATATSTNSRNFSLGKLIAEGKSLEEAKEILKEVAEGVHTLQIVRNLAKDAKIGLPICEVIYQVVFNQYPMDKALKRLTFYPSKTDVEFL